MSLLDRVVVGALVHSYEILHLGALTLQEMALKRVQRAAEKEFGKHPCEGCHRRAREFLRRISDGR